jgi:capsular polysaccharide biosynthesis protein
MEYVPEQVVPHLVQTIMIEIALFRAGLIALGIVGALLANSLLFPRHCRVGGAILV